MDNDTKDKSNPLAEDVQREKSGSDTHRKYNYQYHWALCRILEAHEDECDYALFIECHEDVVLASSLNPDSAMFEFNQVKETVKKHTSNSLFSLVGKNSTLGKIILDSTGKSFADKIDKINLVSTGGFDLKLEKEGLNLDIIELGSLADEEISALEEKLEKELPGVSLPTNLSFVLPDLPPKDFRNAVKGRILTLLDRINPGGHNNTGLIYSILIEDLDGKGEDTFDYLEWERALKKKAITSQQVQRIIESNIKRKVDTDLTSSVNEVLLEYDYKSLRKRNIRRAFQRYYNRRLGRRDTLLIKFSDHVRHFEEANIGTFEEVSLMEKAIRESLPTVFKKQFDDEDSIIAAILYELLSE